MAKLPDATERLLAEGQAALLLVESVLLVLIEAKVVDKEQVIDAIETVIGAKRSLLSDGEAPEIVTAAIGLLSGIANSLSAAASGPSRAPPATVPCPSMSPRR